MTDAELELKRLNLQKYGMYIGFASLIISALSLYYMSQTSGKK